MDTGSAGCLGAAFMPLRPAVHDLLGRAEQVAVVGSLAETSVDGHVTLALHHGGQRQASVGTSLWGLSDIGASVLGTEGRVTFGGPFLRPTTLRLHTRSGNSHHFDGTVRNGFRYETAEVPRCVTEGRPKVHSCPLDDSIAVLEVIDTARRARSASAIPGSRHGADRDQAVRGAHPIGVERATRRSLLLLPGCCRRPSRIRCSGMRASLQPVSERGGR
jgi:hypothetical protein